MHKCACTDIVHSKVCNFCQTNNSHALKRNKMASSGEAYSWGMGTNHQLGTGEEEDSWSPTKITGKKMENRRVLAVSAGGQHAALLISRQDPAE